MYESNPINYTDNSRGFNNFGKESANMKKKNGYYKNIVIIS